MNPSNMHPALTTLSEEEELFFQTVKEFADEQIKPREKKMDEQASFDPGLIKQFFEMGLMGIDVPEKYGGAETSFFMSILAIEALSSVDPSAGVIVDVQNTLVNNAFMNYGSEQLQSKYLPLLCEKKVGAYALSEASSGSDAFALKTRAVDKDDHWLLNGQKLWITNSNEAEIFIIFANVDPEKGYKGITAFIVERDFEGFSVGKKEDKLGIRASSTCELILEDCKVPKESVLGEVGKGYRVAIETLDEGRIGIGAQMVGLAQGALNEGIRYAKEREQFGKTIAEFQAVQFQFAQAASEIEAARLLVYNAARLKDSGKPFVKEAAMAKLVASEWAQKISSLMIDIHGGYGFTKEYRAEKYFRDSKIGSIYEGTSNMQLQTIAKQILKE
ncbi:MAG: acyl-CoA dehydrogenase [Caldithrix sp.]|nr:acyl-CoA dehydrogenase [Caldithrix sp.]